MSPVPRSDLKPGQMLLGRYRIERVLGQGGMGIVVAARHVELDQLFAFKFLRGEATSRPEVVERFVREARAAASLESAHIAKVHDVGRLDTGEPYMLMEHLTGRDLHRVLDEDGPLALTDVARHALEACEAVAEAHARGIIHRDLKPSNLFLHELRSGRLTLKVLDFGISKETSAVGAPLTSTHALVGTPLYMSPEQVLQPRLVDARSDVWALGVVLYELSTGQAPFSAEAMPEVIGKILQTHPAPPSSVRPGLPAWFDAIVMRCLEKAVHERFQSIAELAEAIRRQSGQDDPHSDPEATVDPSAKTGAALVIRSPAARAIAVTTCAPVTASSPPTQAATPVPAPPTLPSSGQGAGATSAPAKSLGLETDAQAPEPGATRARASRWLPLGAAVLLAGAALLAIRSLAPGGETPRSSAPDAPSFGATQGTAATVAAVAPSPIVSAQSPAAPAPMTSASALIAPSARRAEAWPSGAPTVSTASKSVASPSAALPSATAPPRPASTAEPTLH